VAERSLQAHYAELARIGVEARIEAGQVLWHEGDPGDTVALLPIDAQTDTSSTDARPVERSRVTKLYVFEGLDRIEVERASAGEIVALAGLEGVEIGLTITDVDHPDRLEGIAVEGSAESLGRHVTSSVVKAIFMVIVLDGLFAMFFAAIRF